jgi:hypothetical protein
MAGVKKLFELKENRGDTGNETKNMPDRVWEFRSSQVCDWILSNKALIPNDGTIETIHTQLARGDNNSSAREKCWKHLEIELEAFPQWSFIADEGQRNPILELPMSPTRNSPMIKTPLSPPHAPLVPVLSVHKSGSILSPRKSPFRSNDSNNIVSAAPVSPTKSASFKSPVPMLNISRSESATLQSSGPRSQSARGSNTEQGFVSMNLMSARTHDEDEKVVKGISMKEASSSSEYIEAEVPVVVKPISQMTMMERQAYWLAKKKETLEAQRAEKEKEDEQYSFKPNIVNSKRTFSNNQLISKTSSSQQLINKVIEKKESNHRMIVESKTSNNSKTKLKSAYKNISAANKLSSLNKTQNSTQQGVKKHTRTSISKRSTKDNDDENDNDDDDDDDDNNDEAAEEYDEEGTNLDNMNDKENVNEVGGGGGDLSKAGDVEEEEAAEQTKAVEPPPPVVYVPGEFWWREEGGRGHHRVRDGSEFQMWSIYRRKDKNREIKGVSMLVGRMEKPPYDEKVIQIMFDTEHWTEESSFRWWQLNSIRYTGEADHGTGKLRLEVMKSSMAPPPAAVVVVARPDHSPIRKTTAAPTTSPIE